MRSTASMDEGGAKQLEYCFRLCEKEPERSSSIVKCATHDMSSRKIAFLDASGTCLVADATSEVANELQLDDQTYQELGEMSYPLTEIRKEFRKWEKKWRQLFMNHRSEPSTFIRCPERELCGIVHDHFIIFDSDFVQLMCTESRLKD